MLPGNNIPVTLLTGLGDGTCFLRAGVDHLRLGVESLTPPLDKLIEVFVQGASALTGDAPQCAPGDARCLSTVSRGTITYRMISFPILYLHFWSLSAPPVGNPCRFVMSTRFT